MEYPEEFKDNKLLSKFKFNQNINFPDIFYSVERIYYVVETTDYSNGETFVLDCIYYRDDGILLYGTNYNAEESRLYNLDNIIYINCELENLKKYLLLR